MAQPQLSVRSAKARDLAHRLARREKRSIADIVERALESYEIREAGREPAASFFARLSSSFGSDVNLETLIQEVACGPFGTRPFIFLDTNVVSETLKNSPSPFVVAWLVRFDAELALPTVTIAEIAFGIYKITPDQRAARLEEGLSAWRRRIRRSYPRPHRGGGPRLWSDHGRGRAPGARNVGAGRDDPGHRTGERRPSGRNLSDARTAELDLVSPWDFK